MRITSAASGITSSTATTATQIDAAFQPYCRTSNASAGRKTSWPVAFAAVMIPVTSPRRRTNQRCATIAANGTDTAPVALPITTPHSSCSCHGCEILVVASDAIATIASAAITTRRIPKRSCSAAANGAARPKHTRLIETADEIVARLQPNWSCSGTIITLGAERKPALITRTSSVTATIAKP